ncbi:hypothetical protein T4C_12225, partial [Trichinella pseudospiralis]
MEEYVDELEGLAESLSDDGHVEINANIDVEKSADPSIKTIQHPDNKRLFIPTNIAEMNAFFGLLSVAGTFHENHKNPGNYGVSIKAKDANFIYNLLCIMMMLTYGQQGYGGF